MEKQLNEIDGGMKTTGWVVVVVVVEGVGGRQAGGVGGYLDLTVCLSLFAYLLEAQMSALSSLWTPH